MGINDITQKKTEIKIFPNPFSASATLEINEMAKDVSYTFKLYNLLGAEVKAIRNIKNSIQVKREKLPTGMYIYKLYSEGGVIHTGKLAVE